jgi:ureidoacrylate peracid hydrolase
VLTTLAEKVDPRHAALLVIDVTNDFCSEKSPRTARRQNLATVQDAARRIDAFIGAARRAGMTVIFIKPGKPKEEQSDASKEQLVRSSVTFAPTADRAEDEEEWGRDFYAVSPLPGELVFEKSRYSAFIDTNLKDLLVERGIRSLLMTGVSTNVCVESTARDAYMLDFYVVLVEDCCGAYKPNLHAATIENINDRFGVAVTGADVQAAWAEVLAGSAR